MATSAVTHLPRDYLELPEAFDRTGQMLHGKDWTGQEGEVIECDGPVDRFGSLWEARSPEAERYKAARLVLFEELWEKRIGVTGITAAGQQGDIPHWAWKDDAGQFTISIRNNRVSGRVEDNTETWRVRINGSEFENWLNSHLQKKRLKSREGRARGGRPPKYNWSEIEKMIENIYEPPDRPSSNRKGALKVRAELENQGKESPEDSQLRKKIVDLRGERRIPPN